MYSLIRPLLFRLDPERAHNTVMNVLAALSTSGMAMRAMRARRPASRSPATSIMGLNVPNRFGLAAGLDKDARAFPALCALGFGWVEVGTVTPRPQPGNERPRLHRLEHDRALINRMGFNSCGVDRLLANLAGRRGHYDSILGVNIGKNAETPIHRAADDYLRAFEKVYPHADYVVVNISSPNTRSLRELQQIEPLAFLIEALLAKRATLHAALDRRVSIAVKLSPDLHLDALQPICALLRDQGVDGVIATNTTTTRPESLTVRHTGEGGLSGRPLEPLATQIVGHLCELLGSDVPVIGAGGVEDAPTAARKFSAGAVAVQCYTAFVYEGPRLIAKLATSQ